MPKSRKYLTMYEKQMHYAADQIHCRSSCLAGYGDDLVQKCFLCCDPWNDSQSIENGSLDISICTGRFWVYHYNQETQECIKRFC